MCNPLMIAAATFAMQAGSAAMQSRAASAQAAQQTQMFQTNRTNALAAMRDDYTTVGIRQQQEQQASSEEAMNRGMVAREQMATAKVAASDAGISGLSVTNVLRDIGASASRDISTIHKNQEWSAEQLNRSKLGVKATAQNRMNSMAPGVKPSGWATAFKIGQAATDSVSSYKTMNSY